MPAYEYTALTPQGREQRGILEGDTARMVRQLLRQQQLTPISVIETRKAETHRGQARSWLQPRVSSKDLALLTRQLATLSRSGSPLEEALATVAKQTLKNHVKSVILGVRSKVLEGHALATALAEYPKVFPELYRATIAAGEQSGHLDNILDRLAEYTEARQDMQQKITLALTYPIILSCVALLIVIGLLTYVVPQVIQVFDNLGQQLPLLTRGLIAVSDGVKAYGLLLLIGALIAGFFIRRLLQKPLLRRRYHRALLSLPIIGNLIRGINTARFARTLSILAVSGVPILDALQIASQVVRNMPMRDAVEAAAWKVREGASLHKALEASGLFPPMMVHLIASGESSGKLEAMLERAAQYQERETTATITTFVGLFEHLMILVMGAVVLVIVLAILLPIFDLNQMVK